jgi:hypothetical protein
MESFRITGLDPSPFTQLYGLSDAALAARGVVRYTVDRAPGFPDRVEMRELEPGERALLLNYAHLDVASPYRSSHAIFVREGALTRYDCIDVVPEIMRTRQLSVRAFDARDMMIEADVIDGDRLAVLARTYLANPHVAYVHVYNAKRGCYFGRIDRA